MKKRGGGEGKWNGSGGKVGDKVNGESIKQAAVREVREELSVDIEDLVKVAIVEFEWPNEGTFAFDGIYVCHVFLCDKWKGEPAETEEMRPKWFEIRDIPYSSMWVTDKHWLPKVLEGENIKARFVFKDDETIEEFEVEKADD